MTLVIRSILTTPLTLEPIPWVWATRHLVCALLDRVGWRGKEIAGILHNLPDETFLSEVPLEPQVVIPFSSMENPLGRMLLLAEELPYRPLLILCASYPNPEQWKQALLSYWPLHPPGEEDFKERKRLKRAYEKRVLDLSGHTLPLLHPETGEWIVQDEPFGTTLYIDSPFSLHPFLPAHEWMVPQPSYGLGALILDTEGERWLQFLEKVHPNPLSFFRERDGLPMYSNVPTVIHRALLPSLLSPEVSELTLGLSLPLVTLRQMALAKPGEQLWTWEDADTAYGWGVQ